MIRYRTQKLLVPVCALSLAITVSTTVAQPDEGGCGTVITAEQIQHELERGLTLSEQLPVTRGTYYPWYIPLKIHIVRFDDGTGGLSTADLQTSIDNVNSLLAPIDVQVFQFGDVDFIDDTDFANLTTVCHGGANHGAACSIHNPVAVCTIGVTCDFERECAGGTNDGTACINDADCTGFGQCIPEPDLLRRTNSVSGTLNVYYVPVFTDLAGQSSFTFDLFQGVIIRNGFATDISTTAHEIGHYFDLYHTHETAIEVECPGGSNCLVAGDLLCDTPADPGLLRDSSVSPQPGCAWDQFTCNGGNLQGRSCSAANNCPGGSCNSSFECNGGSRNGMACLCASGGSCTAGATPPPGCGATLYAPDTHNVMSYGRFACLDDFTPNQGARFFFTWVTRRLALFDRTEYIGPVGGFGFSSGLPTDPWLTVAGGYAHAGIGEHLFIRSGTYAEPLVLNKAVHLKVWNPAQGSVVIGQ